MKNPPKARAIFDLPILRPSDEGRCSQFSVDSICNSMMYLPKARTRNGRIKMRSRAPFDMPLRILANWFIKYWKQHVSS